MSASVMGAVMSCGPKWGTTRFILVAIADNADDFGFACPSIELIAAKACCDERTVLRHIQALERDGWLSVHRHVFAGRGSVYFLNVEKLGVPPNPKSRKSQLHLEVEDLLAAKKPGDNLSPGNSVEKPQEPSEPGDNPQGVQVTKTAIPGDKTPLTNIEEPLLTVRNQSTPLPPSQASGDGFDKTLHFPGGRLPVSAAEIPEEVDRVMLECGLTDRRMRPVIASAMHLDTSKRGTTRWETANRMISNYKAYHRDFEFLRYTVGPKKFFSHGLATGDAGWPYDEEKLAQRRRL